MQHDAIEMARWCQLARSCVLTRRNRGRAQALAKSAGARVTVGNLQDLTTGALRGNVLVQTTSVGMHPNIDDTPVPDAAALRGFELVFDAIYTPLHTRLLKVCALR